MTQLALLNKDNGRAYFGRDGFLFEKTDPYSETLVANNVAAVARFVERAKQAAPGLRARVMLVPTGGGHLARKAAPPGPRARSGGCHRPDEGRGEGDGGSHRPAESP